MVSAATAAFSFTQRRPDVRQHLELDKIDLGYFERRHGAKG